MKKRNRRLLAVLCAVVTAAGIAAPAMTPVYAAQNEVTNEEVNAEVMSAGNTKDDVDDSGKADEQEDVYSLKYITVDGRTTWYYANEKGEVDKSYTGVTDNDYGWWYVKNGEVDFSYTGLGFNDAGCWRSESFHFRNMDSRSYECGLTNNCPVNKLQPVHVRTLLQSVYYLSRLPASFLLSGQSIFYPETLSRVWTVPCGWTILLPGSVRPHYFHRYLFCYTSVFYAFVSFIMHRIASTAVLIAA